MLFCVLCMRQFSPQDQTNRNVHVVGADLEMKLRYRCWSNVDDDTGDKGLDGGGASWKFAAIRQERTCKFKVCSTGVTKRMSTHTDISLQRHLVMSREGGGTCPRSRNQEAVQTGTVCSGGLLCRIVALHLSVGIWFGDCS